MGELKTLVDEHATKMAKTSWDMRGHPNKVDNIVRRIRRELEGGAEKWNSTMTQFDAATQRLMQLCADLQGRPWRGHWVLVAGRKRRELIKQNLLGGAVALTSRARIQFQ